MKYSEKHTRKIFGQIKLPRKTKKVCKQVLKNFIDRSIESGNWQLLTYQAVPVKNYMVDVKNAIIAHDYAFTDCGSMMSSQGVVFDGVDDYFDTGRYWENVSKLMDSEKAIIDMMKDAEENDMYDL